MAATLKNIAEKADVSQSTVSKALNGDPNINEETRKKIKNIADELDYVPHGPARALKSGQTKLIAMVVDRIDNLYYSELTHLVKREVKKYGYNIVLCSTMGEQKEEKEYITSLIQSKNVDGAIFAFSRHDRLIDKLFQRGIPVVYISRPNRGNREIPVVNYDLKTSVYALMEYLINEQDFKEIGYAGITNSNAQLFDHDRRFEAYRTVMEEYDLSLPEQFIFAGFNNYEGGIEVGKKIFQMPDYPSALVCFNDEVALGVIQSLSLEGVHIPREIAITGIDNIAMSANTNPPLTTINLPKEKLGARAGRMLIDLLKEREIPREQRIITFPTELVIRSSA